MFCDSNLIFTETNDNISSKVFFIHGLLLVEWYLVVQFCVWIPGTEAWYPENVIQWLYAWVNLLNRFDFFDKKLVDGFHHGRNQQVSIWRTSFNKIWIDKCLCIANFMDGKCQKKEKVSDFYWETERVFFSKTNGCIFSIKVSVDFFTCKTNQKDQLLRLVPQNSIERELPRSA